MTKAQERAREYYPDSDDKAIIHTISMRAWHERGQEAFTAGYAQGQRDLVEAARGKAWIRTAQFPADGTCYLWVKFSDLKKLAGVE